MYKLKMKGFKYIPPICPRCGSHNTTSQKPNLECSRCGYIGYWTDFYLGKKREEVQKLFLQQNLEGIPPTGLEHKCKRQTNAN